MGEILMTGGGGGGTGSDECTARLSDVPAGLKAVTADSNDEAGVGTMTMTGNAQAGHVLAGETFYTNDYKTKQTGAMTVGSLLSFSVAAYSGKRVLAKWQNPNQAAGKPYSGVMIRYSTNGYPGATGGTQIYRGAGNNTAAGGWSQAFLDMPALNHTYYFSCVPYVTCSAGEMLGAPINFTCATGADLWLTFTAGQNYTVPEGYTLMDAFAVGGGGGSSYGDNHNPSNGNPGGGGGHTETVFNIGISANQTLNITVGSGSITNVANPSLVQRYGVTLISAKGGDGCAHGAVAGGRGGSGGGRGGFNGSGIHSGGNGGSDGSNGFSGDGTNGDYSGGGIGQHTTTRAWGSPSGTLYAGGGGGAGVDSHSSGGGGAGGGGAGGYGRLSYGANGAANTGGGGGGTDYHLSGAASGGSGIILLHLY